jgi:inner membrane protein
MDNITHSLTGALVAKAGPHRHHTRIVFWITVLAANIPDIDFIMQFFGDRMFYMEQHRGLSHSILFAPFFAAFLAWIFSITLKGARFKLLYGYVLAGILVHILFDLITSFGTMIFYPVTDKRYTFDLIFIIDPWFTIALGLILFLSRKYKDRSISIVRGGIVFIAVYFLLAFANREIVYTKAERFFAERNIEYSELLVLPQPFAITNWVVLVRTEDAAYQIFTNSFEKSDQYSVIDYPFTEPNEYTMRAEQTSEARFFRWFSRMPLYDYYENGGLHYIEYYDLQFVLNPRLAERFGIQRNGPFVLRFVYNDDGSMVESDF